MIGVAELFRWVVDVGAAGALLLGVAYGVMLVVRQPARRVRVAEVALIGCLLLLVVQAVPASRISLGIVETGRPMQLPWFDAEGSLSYSSGFSRDAAPIAIVQPLQKTAATFSQLSLYWREALLTLYALGVILAGGRLALACWSLRRLRQRGRQATGELAALWSELTRGRGSAVLLISDEASRPMTF
ncbi:MAG: hypothetical protein FWD53_12325, partial [Phycisphaerales bacterium]|nr:hypothetical protein [Phycisphaerales bacterium]